jgi:hypothetical protein
MQVIQQPTAKLITFPDPLSSFQRPPLKGWCKFGDYGVNSQRTMTVVETNGTVCDVPDKGETTASLEALLSPFRENDPAIFLFKKDVGRFIKTLSIPQSEDRYSLISVSGGKLRGVTASRLNRDYGCDPSEASVVIREFRSGGILDLRAKEGKFPLLPFHAPLLTEAFKRLRMAEVEKTGMSIITTPDERNPGGSFVLFATEAPHTVLAVLAERQKEGFHPFVMVLTLTAFRDTVESFLEEARK